MKQYEHLHVDLSPAALELIHDMLEAHNPFPNRNSGSVGIEVRNFINECRARLQHIEAGMPDPGWPGDTVPSRSDDADWLA